MVCPQNTVLHFFCVHYLSIKSNENILFKSSIYHCDTFIGENKHYNRTSLAYWICKNVTSIFFSIAECNVELENYIVCIQFGQICVKATTKKFRIDIYMYIHVSCISTYNSHTSKSLFVDLFMLT